MIMLTVSKLLDIITGMDPDAQVVVGIIEGPRYNAAYAQQEVCARAMMLDKEHFDLRDDALALHICCYQQPRPWEGEPPRDNGDGSATLGHDPESPAR